MKTNTGNGTPGRVANGQFAPGNPGGPGRPPRQTEREYLRVLAESCSLEDWREIARGAVNDAKDGDAKAREWLARYLVGSPSVVRPALSALAAEEETGVDPLAYEIDTLRRLGFRPAFLSEGN